MATRSACVACVLCRAQSLKREWPGARVGWRRQKVFNQRWRNRRNGKEACRHGVHVVVFRSPEKNA